MNHRNRYVGTKILQSLENGFMQLNIAISEELNNGLKMMSKQYRTTVPEFVRQTLYAICPKRQQVTVQYRIEKLIEIECSANISILSNGVWYGCLICPTTLSEEDMKKLDFAIWQKKASIKMENELSGCIAAINHNSRACHGGVEYTWNFVGITNLS